MVKRAKRRRSAGSGEVLCPFCGEPSTVQLDAGGGAEQSFVEDCEVCCRPRLVHVTRGDDGEVTVTCEREE